MAVVQKTIAHRVACGARVLHLPPNFFIWLRSSTESERKNTNLEVAGSNPAEAANQFRGRQTGRTLEFESRNKGSNHFPEAKLFTSGRSADDYTGWTWNPVFAGLNPAAQTNFS